MASPLTATDWGTTATAAILYDGPILYFLLAFFGGSDRVRERGEAFATTPAITCLSKAALHIYIFQMLWYYVVNAHLDLFADWPLALTTLFCVLCCTGFGVALYEVEKRVRARLSS